MLAFINELSLPLFDSRQRAKSFLNSLAKLCVQMRAVGIKEAKIPASFQTHQFAQEYTFHTWINDGRTDSDNRTLLLDMLTTTPSLDELLDQYQEDKDNSYEFKYEGTRCIGLGLASDLVYDTAAVSFSQEDEWQKNFYSITQYSLDTDEEGNLNILETPGNVRNIAAAQHCRIHKADFQKLVKQSIGSGRELWERRNELFSHLDFCSKVEAQLMEFDSSMPVFTQIIKRLFELQDFAAGWDKKPINGREVGIKVTPESDSRLKDKKIKKQLTIPCPDGVSRLFNWHARYTPGAGRIYFIPFEAKGRFTIGSIALKFT